jgi:hypothetical protein
VAASAPGDFVSIQPEKRHAAPRVGCHTTRCLTCTYSVRAGARVLTKAVVILAVAQAIMFGQASGLSDRGVTPGAGPLYFGKPAATAVHASDWPPAGTTPADANRPRAAAASRSSNGRFVWAVSVVALVGANVADLQSSWGKKEANTILAGQSGTFGTRGAVIKVSLTSLVCVAQRLVLRRRAARMEYQAFTVMNFSAAAVLAATATHNHLLRAGQHP